MQQVCLGATTVAVTTTEESPGLGRAEAPTGEGVLAEATALAQGATQNAGRLAPALLEKRRPLLAFAVIVALVSLLGPIAQSGIWDPYELEMAEFARRIGLNLLGGEALFLEGADNRVPIRSELGKGELPFTSVAIGFRLFGLHDWAGRLPLALWGLLGLSASYLLMRRLSDRVSAAFAVLILATMPLYFLHARTMLGDIVTMASLALSTAGLALAVFSESGRDRGSALRGAGWFLLGALGLGAGFGARGVLIGVAVPALAVGVAWLLRRTSAGLHGWGLRDAYGVVVLAIGALCVVSGLRALAEATDNPGRYFYLLGSEIEPQRQRLTFDAVVHALGHGLFPYSAVLPFAMGRMLAPPIASDAEAERQGALRSVLLLVSIFGFAAYSVMADGAGPLPFAPVFALACMIALALGDLEKGRGSSRAFAMSAGAMAVLLCVDFKNFPEKAFSAFAVGQPSFPESLEKTASRLLQLGTVAFSGVFFFALAESQKDDARRFDVRGEYLVYLRKLRAAFGGNLWFMLLALQAALLIGFAGVSLNRWVPIGAIERLPAITRQALELAWLVLPALVLAPMVLFLIRDVFRALFSPGLGVFRPSRSLGLIRITRATAAVGAVVAFGLTLSLGYYPALAAQISPKQVFEAYRELAGDGELLGTLGMKASSATYYTGSTAPAFSSEKPAFNWLTEGEQRRWLVIRADDLARMNSLYRKHVRPSRNLPVLDARSSEILLVSNRLNEGERSQNPFDAWILNEAPVPARPLQANLGNKLEVLGWEIRDPEHRLSQSVVAGKPYDFIIYYRVLTSISGDWETFIHIDGFKRRFNGDHPTLEGKYSFNLWRPGDFVADIHRFALEPNFTPGSYQVFFGLFRGSRRLEVKRGAHHENRIKAGTLQVE